MKFKDYLKINRAKLAAKNGGKFTQLNMVELLNENGINVERPTYGNWESGFATVKNEERIELVKNIIKTALAK